MAAEKQGVTPAGRRAKGNRFELEVAKAFSAWWGEERSFRRTPLSGAWDKRAGGDLVAPDGFPFTIEAKNQERWELHHLLMPHKDGESCLLDQFWLQALRETTKGKKPLLVFTKNLWPTFYMMAVDHWMELGEDLTGTPTFVVMTGDTVRVVGILEDLLRAWRPPR